MADSRILFICGMVDEDDPGFGRMKSIDISADTLTKLFYSGFKKNLSAPVDVLRDRYGLLFPDLAAVLKKEVKAAETAGGQIVTAAYLNRNKLLKMVSKSFTFIFEVLKWTIRNKEPDRAIIIYSLHFPYIIAALTASVFSKSVRFYCIVPDLPMHMDPELGEKRLKYFLKKVENRIYKRLLNRFSAFIALSEETSAWLMQYKKKVFLIPGMVSSEEAGIALKENLPVERDNYILYTGSLEARYGIGDLLEAFIIAGLDDFKLIICGDGSFRNSVEKAAEQHSNISYLGSVPRSEALMLQKRASLLVNPRPSAGEYTRYSFPSKTMEYLLSGTPVLMRPLPGIVPEFEELLFLDKEQTVGSLAERMKEIISMQADSKNVIVKKAIEYIADTKTEAVQTAEFCKELNINQHRG